jgi:hypothetical protein
MSGKENGAGMRLQTSQNLARPDQSLHWDSLVLRVTCREEYEVGRRLTSRGKALVAFREMVTVSYGGRSDDNSAWRRGVIRGFDAMYKYFAEPMNTSMDHEADHAS